MGSLFVLQVTYTVFTFVLMFKSFKWVSLQQPRRFHYEPIYYHPSKDPEILEKRRLQAQREKRLDPLVHGQTLREKMEGRSEVYETFTARYNKKRNKLLRYVFFLACVLYVIFGL